MRGEERGPDRIFVFGSNRAGIHGAGAALHARTYYGALQLVGEGRMGGAYAIPTKQTPHARLPLADIRAHVLTFLAYAREHPELRFNVTRVGCGFAGYSDHDIAPLFAEAPSNCDLPTEPFDWRQVGITWAKQSPCRCGGRFIWSAQHGRMVCDRCTTFVVE